MTRRIRTDSGFTMVEALIAMTLIAFCISLTYGMVNYKDRSRDNIASDYCNKMVEMEKAFNAYVSDKNSAPAAGNFLVDATFVPSYLFVPQAVKGGFDAAWNVNGFYMGATTGGAVNTNGYWIAAKYKASGPTDNTYLAIKQIASTLPASKFFYQFNVFPVTSNMADPAGAVDSVYTTYWISRW